jgi:uncharacterized membrane protein
LFQLFLALVVFVALHSVPALPALRARLIGLLGRRLYLIAYSLVSLASLAWVFYAALRVDYIPLWDPAPWQAWVTLVLTPIGLFLLLAGLFTPNPLSISVRRADTAPGGIVAVTRHPELWGFMLWAASHVVPNGDVRSLVLFGALLLFALAGIPLTDRRARKRLGDDWPALAARTSILPFAAIISRRAHFRLDGPMLAALLLTALIAAWFLTGGHALLFGADPLALATG